MKIADQVTTAKANELLFASEKVECTKHEYHDVGIRLAIETFANRQKDLGNPALAEHAESELRRLDELYGSAL